MKIIRKNFLKVVFSFVIIAGLISPTILRAEQQVELKRDQNGKYYYLDSSGSKVYTDLQLNANTNYNLQDSSGNNAVPGSTWRLGDTNQQNTGGSYLDSSTRFGLNSYQGNNSIANFGQSSSNINSVERTTTGQQSDPTRNGIIPQTPQKSGQSTASKSGSNAVSCSVGQILAGAIGSGISAGVGTIGNLFTSKTGSATDPRVPILHTEFNLKETGLKINGITVFPGVDSIAYCLTNTMIQYISDATIAWINSGFEGNPAFVNNPEQFFMNLSDYEVNQFVGTLQNQICLPNSQQITSAILNDYMRRTSIGSDQFMNQTKCQITNSAINTAGKATGSIIDGANSAIGRLLSNANYNSYDAYINGTSLLNARLAARIDPVRQQIEWGKGTLYWVDQKGNTVTPGDLINVQISQRLGLDESRLVIGDEFDEVITALVNKLTNIALSELFSGGESSGSSSGF